jgi:hypothetical protein
MPLSKAQFAALVREMPGATDNEILAEARRHEQGDPESLLSKIWEKVNTPLTDLPSRVAGKLADKIDQRSLDENPFMAKVKGFFAGATQGAGDVASSLSSPLNLALTAAGGAGELAAAKGFNRAAGAARAFESGVNAGFAGEGLHHTIQGAREGDMSKMGAGALELAAGASRMRNPNPGRLASIQREAVSPPELHPSASLPRPVPELPAGVVPPEIAGAPRHTAGAGAASEISPKPASVSVHEKGAVSSGPVYNLDNAASIVDQLTQKTGGASFNLFKGDLAGTKHYAVATFPDRGVVIEGTPTPQQIRHFIGANQDVLVDPKNSIGTWFNKADGKTYLDVSVTTPSLKEAKQLGRKNQQLAIYNLASGTEIPVEPHQYSLYDGQHAPLDSHHPDFDTAFAAAKQLANEKGHAVNVRDNDFEPGNHREGGHQFPMVMHPEANIPQGVEGVPDVGRMTPQDHENMFNSLLAEGQSYGGNKVQPPQKASLEVLKQLEDHFGPTNMPPEFMPVGEERPYKRPTFPDPREAMNNKVDAEGGMDPARLRKQQLAKGLTQASAFAGPAAMAAIPDDPDSNLDEYGRIGIALASGVALAAGVRGRQVRHLSPQEVVAHQGAAALWAGGKKAFKATVGEHATPTVLAASQKILDRHLATTLEELPTVKKVLSMNKTGIGKQEWYDKTEAELKKAFGKDAPLVARFFAATSNNATVASNASLTLKALRQYKAGEPFTGYLPAVIENLKLAAEGKPLNGRKIDNFAKALSGDPNAVVADRWLMRAFGFNKGTAPTDTQYDFMENAIQQLAKKTGQTPRQMQAAIWFAVKEEAEKGKKRPPSPAPEQALQHSIDIQHGKALVDNRKFDRARQRGQNPALPFASGQ